MISIEFMRRQATSVFKITSGYQEPFSVKPPELRLTTSKFTMIYEGELEGESVMMELKNYLADDMATVYGLERITGKLEGKAGSFVLEHQGRFENGVLTSKQTIVPGSGTGALSRLRGKAHFSSEGEQDFTLTLHYYFE